MIKYLIPTSRDADLFREKMGYWLNGKIVVIGENAEDMCDTVESDILVNVGYVKGFGISCGTLVEPSRVIDERGNMIRIDSVFPIMSTVCFTGEEMVDKPLMCSRAIYDTELFKIAERPHKRLHCIKIVRDELKGYRFRRFNGDDVWGVAAVMVARYVVND